MFRRPSLQLARLGAIKLFQSSTLRFQKPSQTSGGHWILFVLEESVLQYFQKITKTGVLCKPEKLDLFFFVVGDLNLNIFRDFNCSQNILC